MISFREGIEIRRTSCLSVGIVLVLLLSTIAGSIGQADHPETGAEKRQQDVDDLLGEELKETLDPKEEDDLVEVMIRFKPYDSGNNNLDTPLNDIDTEKVVSDLKEHSESKQSDVVEFLENSEGKVLNTFWIANAVLAEVPVGMLNDLVEHTEIWKIHKNFEVETYDYNDLLDNKDILKDGFSDTLDIHDEKLTDETSNKNRRSFLETSTFESMRTDSKREVTWGLERLGVKEVWAQGYDGSGVRVAVSDTGVDIDHPDLEGKMVNIDNSEYYTGGWIEFDSEGNIVGNSTPHDTSGHGTHVSGTVVGGNASGTSIGIAPGSELMHALVLPGGQGTFAQTLAGMEWKVEPHDRFGDILEPKEEYRADVASMSWGSYGYDEEKEEPIKNLVNAGIVPIAAVGNLGEGTFGSPAAIYEAFAVGASNESDGIAGFSSGDIVEDEREDTPEEFVKPDFSAPGVDIKSAVPDSEWKYASGTSMAAPHLAGTIALMLNADRNLSVEDIYDGLKITADYYENGESLPNVNKTTRYGHGIINARKAIDSVTGNITVRGVDEISRHQATLKGEVLRVPDSKIEVFFRYREKGMNKWEETEAMTLNEPQKFETMVEGLNKTTTYEFKAVGVILDEEETSLSLLFTTHDDVEIQTLSSENLTWENVTLKGKMTDLYRDDVNLFFRYREKGEEIWNETPVETVSDPTAFEYELDLEKLDGVFICEYKAVAVSGEDEFIGEIIRFPAGTVEPEWDEDEEAYMITNVGELQWMKNDLEGDYILQNDIDASWTRDWPGGNGFEPIGNESERFNGSLYGRGYKISGLFMERHRGSHIGLFGYVGEKGVISEIGIVDYEIPRTRGAITGGVAAINHGIIEKSFSEGVIHNGRRGIVGGLVGYNNGTIERSNSSVDFFIEDEAWGGGLVGWNKGKIIDSHASGLLSGQTYLFLSLGGVAGINFNSIIGSYSTANLRVFRGAVGAHVGGVVAHNYGEVNKSYSIGKIEPLMVKTAGGLIGENYGKVDKSYATNDLSPGALCGGGLIGENSGNVTDSYATGEVNGGVAGGLIGENSGNVTDSYATGVVGGDTAKGLIGENSGNVTDSYWDMGRSGIFESDGGTGLTTLEMRGDNAPNNMEGFDFDKVWNTVERKHDDVAFDGYPVLRALDRSNQTFTQKRDVGTMVNTLRVLEKGFYSAMLRGEFVPMNITEEVEVNFQYRKVGKDEWTETYSKTVDDIEEFEVKVESLQPGTKYEVRAHGEGENFEIYGVTLKFNTEELSTFELDIDSTKGGEVIEPGEGTFEYDEMSEINLEAVPDENYHFVGWKENNETIQDTKSNSTTIKMLDNYSITADFERTFVDWRIEDFEVEPDETGLNEKISITGEIENTGTTAGNISLIIEEGDDSKTIKEWHLKAGEKVEINETYEFQKAGEHKVKLEEHELEVTVEENGDLFIFTLFILVIGMIIAVGTHYKKI